MGPLPLLSCAFLLGLVLPSSPPPPWPTAVVALVLAAVGVVSRSRSGGVAALALVAASALAGMARAGDLHLPALPSIPSTDVARVRGWVTRGCAVGPHGERCTLATARHGTVLARFTDARCGADPGDVVEAVATLRPLVPLRNPPRASHELRAALDGTRYRLVASGCDRVGRSRSPVAAVRRAARRAREALVRGLDASLSAASARRARALLFGDTTAMDERETAAFRASGLAHLLAVSGAHVALLTALAGVVARALLVRVPWLAAQGLATRLAHLAPLPLVGFFVVVTGESPSSVRALATYALVALATLAGRAADGASVVAAVALAMAAVAPTLALDPGWQLSVIASWALARAPTRGEDDVLPEGLLQGVASSLRDAAVASARVALAVVPVLAWHAGAAPLTATVMNAVAAPVGEAVGLPATLVAAGAGVALPGWCARAVGAPVGLLLDALFALPGVALRLPLASVALPPPAPAAWVVATVAVVGALGAPWRAALRWLLAGAAIVAAVEAAHLASARPRGVLRVTALDVGQGDAVVVDLPDGEAMLVDGGGALPGADARDPGEREVVPWLLLRRRASLAAVVLSHPHPDHAGGLAAVLRRVRVGALWDTGQGAALRYGGAYAAALEAARSRGVPVVRPKALCGPPRPFHGAVLEVLAPCPGVDEATPPNDASFVLRLSVGRGSVLLPGDLEREGEARLLERLAPTTALKVPHHGSRTSSTAAFLARLRPRVALVSAGHPSPFGHPHPSVVARYRALGIELRRTDLAGAVSVTVHPDGRVE